MSYPGFTFLEDQPQHLGLRKQHVRIQYRRAQPVPTEEVIILQCLEYLGGVVDELVLGTVLGFALTEDFTVTPLLYRDAAEVAIWEELLAGLADFGLIRREDKTIARTAFTHLAATQRVKYQYFRATCSYWEFEKLTGPADFPFHEFGFQAALTNEVLVEHPGRRVELQPGPDTKLSEYAWQQLKSQVEVAWSDLSEVDYFGSTNQYATLGALPVTGYCYRLSTASPLADATDYRFTVAVNEMASPLLTRLVNQPANEVLRREWGHFCEFARFWQDSTVVIDATQLQRFSQDWKWADLLADSRLSWFQPEVLPALARLVPPTYHSQLSTHIPPALCQARFDEFPEIWNWTVLSARLDHGFISAHLTQSLDGELQYPWDFEVLSQRNPAAVESWLTQLLQSSWANQLVGTETFQWDWAVLANRLSETFILAHLAVLPFSRSLLLERGAQFLEAALKAEMEAGRFGTWNREQVLTTVSLPFLWEHLEHLVHLLPWHGLLGRLLAVGQLPPSATEQTRLLALLRKHRDDINPLTTQPLAWTPELIAVFDELGLLQWASGSFSPGFEQHPAVAWTAEHFARYHSRVRTAAGAAFVSAQLREVERIVEYPDFAWDWAALSSNEHLSWTPALTTRYLDRIVWSRLLQQFGPSKVALRLSGLHTQLQANAPASLPDLWAYANQYLPVSVLLSWYTTYREHLNLAQLCRRDPDAVVDFLLIQQDFNAEWNWPALVNSTPAKLELLLSAADKQYRLQPNEQLACLSQAAAPHLELEYSLTTAPGLALPWDWKYISGQLSPTQLAHYVSQLAPKIDWTQIVSQEAMHFLLTTVWVLDAQVQPWLPWSLVTPLLSPEQVQANWSPLAVYLDWPYLMRQPELYPLLHAHLLDHPVVKEYLPWDYILSQVISPDELVANLPLWSRRLTTLHNPEVRSAAFAAFTRQLPVEVIAPTPNGQPIYPRPEATPVSELPLDWPLLSADSRLAQHFTRETLRRYRNYWHWPTLSRNTELNANSDYLLCQDFSSLWDWTYISQYSLFIGGYQEQANKQFKADLRRYNQFVDWAALSLRQDVVFSAKILTDFRFKSWDWKVLSASAALRLEDEGLLALQNRDWDWATLSANPRLSIHLETVEALANQDWDWAALSANPSLRFDGDSLCRLAKHAWDWPTLTRHHRLKWTADLMHALADYPLDWAYLATRRDIEWSVELLRRVSAHLPWLQLSRNPPFDLTVERLREFQAYWSFKELSRSQALADWWEETKKQGVKIVQRKLVQPAEVLVSTVGLPWDWKYLSERTDIAFNTGLLDGLKSYLHWPTLSRREWGYAFQTDWLQRYLGYWDLVALAVHAALPEPAQQPVLTLIKADTTRVLPYLYSLERHAAKSEWAGYAFHCTHLTNAASIIRSGQLLSRREVRKTPHKLADASGSINFHPSPVWDYARLYYRPQTFTQYYTEQLGLDWQLLQEKKMKDPTPYYRAESLGFPKCPIPIYFRFRLSEILATQLDHFYVSDGNMQSSNTDFDLLAKMLHRIDTSYLLYHHKEKDGWLEPERWQKHKDISQQEILIKSGLSLSKLGTVDIFVPDYWAAEELRRLIGHDHPLAAHIQTGYGCFRHENRSLECSYSETHVEVNTDFTDPYDLVLECADLDTADLSEMPAETYRRLGNKLIAEKILRVSWPTPTGFRVLFRDKVDSRPGGRREYELFQQEA
ncbi:DUF4433 domain-containing protein (plasmid) [Hymenobacter sp. NBH84]|uniref:DarT ssDNA thymidine ADP-ribosyltransferase family protein n=1 Tax=Hymenobacter sp. NBH84 TaxID=2596915 RepID=UPI0016296F73|nr:DarT ssDNA thymidine ADP-ribosyltransferase family protein [Hymenobacter sp. NBH84]QNE41912.1 DUF4433 domain-containing protein [Hymenobacter sp. NBH84]